MAHAQVGTMLRQIRGLVQRTVYDDSSDGELLERFRVGREEAAFGALLRRHGPMVLNVCRRIQGNLHDAEDVFQATFLLLARKAGSIRKRESVAGWLHGVAHRLALAAKGQGARRQARERRAADMRKTSGSSDRAWQDLQATLDVALGEMPERYRAPLLLCYLEGKTHEEAARCLGCPLGTVRSRVARGRERLREVLERHGVRLSVAGLVLALAGGRASTAVAAPLARSTTRAALDVAAGKTAAGLVSARAAALLEGGLKAMRTTKLKIATGIVLAVSALGLGAALAPRVLAELPLENAGLVVEAAPAPAAPLDQPEGSIIGRVLGPDGKPVAGARLVLTSEGDKLTEAGVSGADGRFTITLPKDAKRTHLIAQANGAGIDFVGLQEGRSAGPVGLRLVPDQPVSGRIVDTEGKPVAGVRVTAGSVSVYKDNSVDSFLVEWKKRHFMSGIPSGVKSLWHNLGSRFVATTDADGRFRISGLGTERLVSFRLHGPGIADAELWVVTRTGFDPKPYNQATHDNIPSGFEKFGTGWLLHGPDMAVIAEAEKIIQGAVLEADSGKGRAGVEVLLTRYGEALASLFVSAKTDANGRYEIHGARKSEAYMVEVKSDVDAGYLACQGRATDSPGYQPITINLRAVKGVLVTGKVLDKSTGKPVPGYAMVGVITDNPFVKEYPEFNSSAWMERAESRDDGTFRFVTIPGPVMLMGGPDVPRLPGGQLESMKYKPPIPDPKYPNYFTKGRQAGAFYTTGGAITPLQGNYCKVLEIERGAVLVHQDIELEPASALPVAIQDAEGRPLKGAFVTGIGARDYNYPIRVEADTCSAYFVAESGKPRVMAFYHPERQLVGALTLKGDEKGTSVAKLGPAGSAKGRLLDGDGKPIAGIRIEVFFPIREVEEIHNHMHRTTPQVHTAVDGTFRIDGLVPGMEFKLDHHRQGRSPLRANPLIEKLTVKPGETLDLGDLKGKLPPKDGGE